MEEIERVPTESEVKGDQIFETQKPVHDDYNEDKVPIKRGKVDSLVIYEVTENELNIIENGSETSIFLNFSIFLLSIAFSFLIALLTGDFTNKIFVYNLFCVITICGFIIGTILLILWFRKKDSFSEVVKKIKKRIKE